MTFNSIINENETITNLGLAIDQISNVVIIDENWTIQYINDSFLQLSQYEKEELVGQNYRFLNDGIMPQQNFEKMVKETQEVPTWSGRTVIRLKNGAQTWLHTTIVTKKSGNSMQYVFFHRDITHELIKKRETKSEYEKYRLIAENSEDLIALVDETGHFRYASPSFQSLLNYDPNILIGQNIYDLIHADDQKMLKHLVETFCRRKKISRQLEFRISHENGTMIDVDANISTIKNHLLANDELILFVMRDIRIRKIYEDSIYHLAYHDPLTDLPNRRLFTNQLKEEIKDAKLTNSKLSVLFIDLDNFKEINDQWGHDTGDLALKETARLIKNVLHPNDVVARLGGDEFIVMTKSPQKKEEILKYANHILNQFQKPIPIAPGQEHQLAVSIGIAIYPDGGDTPAELIKNADEAMYKVKRTGKQNIMIFDHQLKEQSLERRLLENAMRTGVKEKQFYLEYQPKLNMITNTLVGMEALVRWNHPDLGRISPGKFIPLAEETGLIIPLGEWILQESIQQTKAWQDSGYHSLTVSINVSVRQLDDPNFIKKLRKIVKDSQIDPQFVELEVTESVFADIDNAANVLSQIRELGLQISVDDFGTGYSSLSYIKNLPIDTLKVDASFIRDIHTNEESKAIAKAVLTLAKTIGLNVIAEGVELEEHVRELSSDGYLYGQGYYFSRPLSPHDFEKYIILRTA